MPASTIGVTNNPVKFAPDATIVHLDVDPASISKIINADIPIVGPAATVLAEIDRVLETKLAAGSQRPGPSARWPTGCAASADWRDEHGLDHDQRHRKGLNGSLLPQQVVQSVYRATKGQAFVTSDVGQHQMFAAQYYKFDAPRRWINSGGLGTMGFGLPAAMGVQFAHPDGVVACITGEGSFMMNMQELSTCMQYALPIKIINLNNQALGMVKQWQDMQYGGRHSHSTYRDALPDFKALTESFGHVAYRIDHLDDLDDVMADAFGAKHKDDLVFVDAHIDPEEHVYPMAIKGRGDGRHGARTRRWARRHPRRPLMRRLLAILLENEAGALSRVIGLFAQRNYNIETLNVAPTEDETLSRVTLSTTGDENRIEQITKHLNRLIEVVKVVDLTDGDHLERELMLIKVRAVADMREEVKRCCDIFRGTGHRRHQRCLHDPAHRNIRETRRVHSRAGRDGHSRGRAVRRVGDRARRQDTEPCRFERGSDRCRSTTTRMPTFPSSRR